MSWSKLARAHAALGTSLLHKALGALGLSVSVEEHRERRVGESTRERLTELGIASSDDDAMRSAIDAELDRRGMTGPDRSFTVSGIVRSQGQPLRRQLIVAFDVDLRGVGAYRSVAHASELTARAGFECLGCAASDAHGVYTIAFHD